MMSDEPFPAEMRPTNVRWVVFVLGCGTSWMLYLHRYTFALLKPTLKDEFGLDKPQLGLLDSAFSTCYSLFQFPSGLVIDLTGVHLFLGGLIILWSIALGLHATATTTRGLWYARALFGLGQAGAFASVSRLTRTWFPSSSRTSVQGWMGVFSGRFGGLSANVLFATVMIGTIGLGWRTAIYILAGAGILLGLAFLALYRNSPRHHPLANAAEADLIEGAEPGGNVASDSVRKKLKLKEVFSRTSGRSLWNLAVLTLSSNFSTLADNIYSAWIPLFLHEVHKLEFKEMGLYSALPLLGGACGGVCGGFLNDRLIRMTGNRRLARSAVGFGGKGMGAVTLGIAMLYYSDPYVFCSMLFAVKFFADMGLASRWGTVTDIGGEATASVFALNNSLAGIAAVIAPIVYGYVSEFHGWPPVFYIAIAMYTLCAVSWLFVNCTIPVLSEESDVETDATETKSES
jgi:sugar phosphate permease